MPRGLNKVMLIGYVGRDPEVQSTASGTKVSKFSIGTTEVYTNSHGERKERTEWHKLTAYGGLAEIVEQYVSKGALVYVEGALRTEKWEGLDGTARQNTHIVVSVLNLLARPQGSGGKSGKSERPAEDELPF